MAVMAATFDFTTFPPCSFLNGCILFYSQDDFVQISLLFANPQASLLPSRSRYTLLYISLLYD